MDLHAGHWLRRCKYCRTVITQCRCMGLKGTVWSVCDKDDCKARFAKESRAESAHDAELARLRAENERLMAVVEAAKCIRHWHDREPDGMVVSAEHVRLLWVALAALDQERKEGR